MSAQTPRPAWTFYAGWVALSVLALPCGLGLAFGLDFLVSPALGDRIVVAGQSHITEDFLLGYFLFGMVGLATGVLQMELLRRVLPRATTGWGWWIAATAAGYMLPFIIGPLLVTERQVGPLWEMDHVRGAITLSVIGAGIAVAQWLVLRRKVQQAVWWIPITIAGWALAGLAGGVELYTIVEILPVALIPPAATAAALWLLLDRRPMQSAAT